MVSYDHLPLKCKQLPRYASISDGDNCSFHLREDILQTLADYHVKVVTFPPHTTSIFQFLDLSLFSVLKKKMNYRFPLGSNDSVVAFIRRIFHNLKQTLPPDIVRSAFVHIGVEYTIDAEPYLLIFDESVFAKVQDFTFVRYNVEIVHYHPENTVRWISRAER
jgi:hypothetical protein